MSSSENGSWAVGRPVIEIRHLTRRFGATTAVDNVSFGVFAGEVMGFIGPNGAGKTTTMRILASLDIPDAGEAWVDGFSVIDDPDRVRRRLGFMPDSFGTYPNMTCEEYLDFFARSYGLKGAQRRAALSEVISFTQLDQMAEKPVDGLSKGMKQRLCLGRALIHDPSVMILDEPAAGLDPRARIELREMIVRLAGNGKAVLISSHILTELAEMCDRVAIIELGQLLAVGNVDEIIRSSRTKVATSDDGLGADPHSVIIELVVLSDPAEAVGFLEQLPAIRHIKLFQKTILFQTVPDLEAQAELLAALIGRGVRVAQYRVKERSLEDAFLHVTRGQVQ